MPDEPVQGGEERVKARPVLPVRLPALQHEGVQGRGAVEGGGEPVLIHHGLHHLETKGQEVRREMGSRGQRKRGAKVSKARERMERKSREDKNTG